MYKKMASDSFPILGTHILHYHKKNIGVCLLDISRFTFWKVDYYWVPHSERRCQVIARLHQGSLQKY